MKQDIQKELKKPKLNPEKPAERQQIIEEAVQRTVKEYGKTLEKLGAE